MEEMAGKASETKEKGCLLEFPPGVAGLCGKRAGKMLTSGFIGGEISILQAFIEKKKV